MHTWARRGLQTALVTGGLLMLGTGIASAQENVNPDKPASGLDGQLSVPVDFHDNQIGTPLGQIDLPNYQHTFKTPDVGGQLDKATKAVPNPVAKPMHKAADKVTEPVSKVTDKVTDTAGKAASKAQDVAGKSPLPTDKLPTDKLPTGKLPVAQQADTQAADTQAADTQAADTQAAPNDPLRGNTLVGDLAVPIDVSGNAIALGGPANVESTDSQSYSHSSPVSTSGDGALAGNVVGLDWALPLQVTGNALALGSEATSTSTSSQDTSVGGDVSSSGDGGALAGNVLMGQLATPLQLTGNAIAGGGSATSESTATSTAAADGSLKSSGDDGVLAGNVGGAPIALPVGLSGNGLSGLGFAAADAATGADASAGSDDRTGRSGVPTYIDTTGNHSLLSGTAAAPTVSNPIAGNGNAGGLLGNSATTGATDNTTEAGGFLSSYGKHALGSGTVVNPTLATPVEAISNAVGGGVVDASADNTVNSTAGEGSYTNGKGSVLSATNIAGPVAYPVDVFGNALGVVGNAVVDPDNDVTATSGGYNGTIGDDSLLTANEVETPIAGAAEAFGNSVGALGSGVTSVTETKTVSSDGGGNTNDDNGVLSSNLAQVAGALPLQVFSGSISALGSSESTVANDSDFTGGGTTEASGKGGFAAGNIVQAPVSLPAQAFGDAVSALGLGDAAGESVTSSSAGGDASTTGEGGTVTGDVVSAPVAGAGQLFGDAVSVVAGDDAIASNDTTSTAGGTVTTTGDNGTIAGDVVTAQLLPVLQGFGDAVGVVGNDDASGVSNTVATSGGDIDTSGEHAALSGDIVDIPAAVVGQAFGDGVGLLSNEVANGDNTLTGTVGGVDSTSGDKSSGSGIVSQNPIGIVGQLYNVSVPLLSNVVTSASNASTVTVADQPAQFQFPFDGGGLGNALPANTMPKLPDLAQLPSATGAPAVQSASPAPSLPTPADVVPSGLPGLSDLAGGSALSGALPEMSGDLAPQAMTPQDGPVVPGMNNVDLNLLDLPETLPAQPGQLSPVSNPGLSGLDTAPLQQAFAELQSRAGNLGQQAGGLHSATSALKSFTGNLPMSGGQLPTV